MSLGSLSFGDYFSFAGWSGLKVVGGMLVLVVEITFLYIVVFEDGFMILGSEVIFAGFDIFFHPPK